MLTYSCFIYIYLFIYLFMTIANYQQAFITDYLFFIIMIIYLFM